MGGWEIAGSGVVPPSVCDLGRAITLTKPHFLHFYNVGLDPIVLESSLFISDKMSRKVR